MVTLYSNSCTPCTNKVLWKRLRSKAAEKRVLLSRKDVRHDPAAKYDADVKYGLPLPFIVGERGVAVSTEQFING